MKLFAILFFALCLYGQPTIAEYKDLNPIIKKAAKNGADLKQLLKAIKLEPTQKYEDGKRLIKVTHVQKGSVYDRGGVKVGDMVTMGDGPSKIKKEK